MLTSRRSMVCSRVWIRSLEINIVQSNTSIYISPSPTCHSEQTSAFICDTMLASDCTFSGPAAFILQLQQNSNCFLFQYRPTSVMLKTRPPAHRTNNVGSAADTKIPTDPLLVLFHAGVALVLNWLKKTESCDQCNLLLARVFYLSKTQR